MPGLPYRVSLPFSLTKEEEKLLAKYETFKNNKKQVKERKKKKDQSKKLMDLVYSPGEPSQIEKVVIIKKPNQNEEREFQRPIRQGRKSKEHPEPEDPGTSMAFLPFDVVPPTFDSALKTEKFKRPKRKLAIPPDWDHQEVTESKEDSHETKMKKVRELVIYDEMDLFS